MPHSAASHNPPRAQHHLSSCRPSGRQRSHPKSWGGHHEEAPRLSMEPGLEQSPALREGGLCPLGYEKCITPVANHPSRLGKGPSAPLPPSPQHRQRKARGQKDPPGNALPHSKMGFGALRFRTSEGWRRKGAAGSAGTYSAQGRGRRICSTGNREQQQRQAARVQTGRRGLPVPSPRDIRPEI